MELSPHLYAIKDYGHTPIFCRRWCASDVTGLEYHSASRTRLNDVRGEIKTARNFTLATVFITWSDDIIAKYLNQAKLELARVRLFMVRRMHDGEFRLISTVI